MIDNINIFKKVDTGKSYPVIRIPKSINNILEKYPDYYRPRPVAPSAPTKPAFPNVCLTRTDYDDWVNSLAENVVKVYRQYADIKEYNISYKYVEKTVNVKDSPWFDKFYNYNIVISFLLLCSIPGVIIGEWAMFLLSVLIMIVTDSIWLIAMRANLKRKNKIQDEIKYKENISSHQKALYRYAEALIVYIKRMESYKSTYSEYQKEINEYNENISTKKFNPEIYDIRKRMIGSGGNKLINVQKLYYEEVANVKKGKAESFLYERMVKYDNFPFDIFVNVKIDSNIDSDTSCYFPDFLLCSNNGERYYDIEIDEPYMQLNGKPIHVESMDCERDYFFYRHNVVVIRFAESQVFNYPSKCVQYIVDIHNKITSMHIEDIFNIKCDFKVDRWSEELAVEWSKINYRDSYTPKRLRSSYNIEYEADSWVLISASRLDKKEREKIEFIKMVKWYSRNSLMIGMVNGEERYIDISPRAKFILGLIVDIESLWIETYINKNNNKVYLGYCNG